MPVIYKNYKVYLGIGGRDLCYIEGVGYYPNPKAAQDYIDNSLAPFHPEQELLKGD